MHHCLNVVTEPAARPAALLVRAVEPIEGVDAMRAARERSRPAAARPATRRRAAPIPDARLAAGPGLVAAAFGIDRRDTGIDLCDPASPLRLEAAARRRAARPDVVADAPGRHRLRGASRGSPSRGGSLVPGSPSLSAAPDERG